MVQSGLSTWQAVGMSLMVYAGSAQLASLPLLAAGTPLVLVWASAAVVNLRFVIYSVAMRPWFKPFAIPKKSLMGVGVTDVLAADFLRRFGAVKTDQASVSIASTDRINGEPDQMIRPLRYFQWGAVSIWTVWQAMSMLGIALAHLIPAQWALEFVATLALIAMLLPMITDRSALVCVMVAGVMSILFVALPLNLGLLVSVVAGVGVAMMLDRPPADSGARSS
jgi:predicted branched-subunit amino acid permease